MAIREIRNIGNDALAQAKKLRQAIVTNVLSRRSFSSSQYDILIRSKQLTPYEGAANKYEAYLFVTSKDGTLLATRKIRGTCSC